MVLLHAVPALEPDSLGLHPLETMNHANSSFFHLRVSSSLSQQWEMSTKHRYRETTVVSVGIVKLMISESSWTNVYLREGDRDKKGKHREGDVEMEAEPRVVQPQAKDAWSHQKLQEAEGFPPGAPRGSMVLCPLNQ